MALSSDDNESSIFNVWFLFIASLLKYITLAFCMTPDLETISVVRTNTEKKTINSFIQDT